MNWSLFCGYFFDALLSIKLTLLALLVGVLGLLSLYLLMETPSYKTSWIMLLPGTERASTISLDNIGEARSNGANAYGSVSISPKNTYKEIALSDAVIGQAAKRYGIATNAFSKPRITLIDQTPAMKFTLKGESRDELVYRANLYNEAFHTTLDTLRSNEIERNFDGVESKLGDAKSRLSLARQEIVSYQTESSIVSDDQFRRWMNDTEQLRTEQTRTEVELAALEAQLRSTLEQLNISAEQAQSLLLLQANPAVNATLNILSEKLADMSQVSLNYASEHPSRKIVQLEIDGLTAYVRKLVSGLPGEHALEDSHLYGLLSLSNSQIIKTVNSLIAQKNGLIAQQSALLESRNEYTTRVKAHTQGAATLADLQRAHQIAEAIFSSALAKLDTSRLDIYATYPLTQLLTQPGATVKRDRLQAKLMVVASIVIYAMLAVALILVQVRKTVIGELSSPEDKPACGHPASDQTLGST